jgi:hypothetical protein
MLSVPHQDNPFWKRKKKAHKILQLRNETKSKPNTANDQKMEQVLVVAGKIANSLAALISLLCAKTT